MAQTTTVSASAYSAGSPRLAAAAPAAAAASSDAPCAIAAAAASTTACAAASSASAPRLRSQRHSPRPLVGGHASIFSHASPRHPGWQRQVPL